LVVAVTLGLFAPVKTGVSVGGRVVGIGGSVGTAVGGGVAVAGGGGNVASLAVGITAVGMAVGSPDVDVTRMQPARRASKPIIKQQKRETILTIQFKDLTNN
jgi:hypothetical protein